VIILATQDALCGFVQVRAVARVLFADCEVNQNLWTGMPSAK